MYHDVCSPRCEETRWTKSTAVLIYAFKIKVLTILIFYWNNPLLDNKTNSQNLFTINIVLKTFHWKHYLQFISIKEKLFSSANVFNSIK